MAVLQGINTVLVVEDEALIAMDVEAALNEEGCRVLGPGASVADAMALLDGELPDCALLDINLGIEKVFPVADRLADAGVPFAFVTGYSAMNIPDRHRNRPLLLKPYLRETLLSVLLTLSEPPGPKDGPDAAPACLMP